MKIICRICDGIACVHGERDAYATKSECVLDCVSSLLKSVSFYEKTSGQTVEMKFVLDDVSADTRKRILSFADELGITPDCFESEHGNANSFKKCIELAAKEDPNEYVFFVEDDYKFEENAIDEMLAFIKKCSGSVMISPVLDSNDFVSYLERENKYQQTIVLPGKSVYWKRVFHTTKTFCIKVCDLIQNFDIYLKEINTGELSGFSTNCVTEKIPCFSPLSVIARHMQTKETLDWFESGCRMKKKYDMRKLESNSDHVQVKENDQIIVSMSTMPWRCENIVETATSLIEGTRSPDKFVLYITHDDFSEIPFDIKEFAKKNSKFEVHWADKNYKVATKLIPALKEYPNSIIINVDDDYVYSKDLVENLYNSYEKDRDAVHTVAGHRIGITSKGILYNAQSYAFNRYDYLTKFRTKGYDIMYLSGHGTLYPAHVFDNTNMFNDEERMSHWGTQDELWGWMNLICDWKQIVVCGDWCNTDGHPWTVSHIWTKNPLWAINNGKEVEMLWHATEYIRKWNPDVLKYFVRRDPVVMHQVNGLREVFGDDLAGLKPVEDKIQNFEKMELPSGRKISVAVQRKFDNFIPKGFDLNPSLKPAPDYSKSF